jgi:hypothetical protein
VPDSTSGYLTYLTNCFKIPDVESISSVWKNKGDVKIFHRQNFPPPRR